MVCVDFLRRKEPSSLRDAANLKKRALECVRIRRLLRGHGKEKKGKSRKKGKSESSQIRPANLGILSAIEQCTSVEELRIFCAQSPKFQRAFNEIRKSGNKRKYAEIWNSYISVGVLYNWGNDQMETKQGYQSVRDFSKQTGGIPCLTYNALQYHLDSLPTLLKIPGKPRKIMDMKELAKTFELKRPTPFNYQSAKSQTKPPNRRTGKGHRLYEKPAPKSCSKAKK